MNEKALRAGCASRGVEVSCKQHRSSAKESQATLCSKKTCVTETEIPNRNKAERKRADIDGRWLWSGRTELF